MIVGTAVPEKNISCKKCIIPDLITVNCYNVFLNSNNSNSIKQLPDITTVYKPLFSANISRNSTTDILNIFYTLY